MGNSRKVCGFDSDRGLILSLIVEEISFAFLVALSCDSSHYSLRFSLCEQLGLVALVKGGIVSKMPTFAISVTPITTLEQ